MKGGKKRSAVAVALLTVLGVLLVLALLGLLFAFLYVDGMLSLMERPPQQEITLSPSEIAAIENETDPVEPDFSGPVLDPTDVTWATEPAELIEGKQLIQILLIGQDRRSGEGRQRSDAMILCSVNKRTGTVTLTSFLRDLYVQIPGYQDNRLNAAYALGGMELLNETLALNFGVQVDGNIEVDFSQFEQIIDMMGGVEIKLTEEEANHINANEGTTLSQGWNLLDGKAALSYSRIRYIGTDFGRTNRQRTVIASVISKCKAMDLTELHDLLEQILPLITTDMTNGEILSYAIECFTLLSDIRISNQHIPAEGTYQFASIRGMSVLVPDLEENRRILREVLMQ